MEEVNTREQRFIYEEKLKISKKNAHRVQSG